jgi:NADH:ubiquinone oxidoreductase subunit 6 (subunit J)
MKKKFKRVDVVAYIVLFILVCAGICMGYGQLTNNNKLMAIGILLFVAFVLILLVLGVMLLQSRSKETIQRQKGQIAPGSVFRKETSEMFYRIAKRLNQPKSISVEDGEEIFRKVIRQARKFLKEER